MARGRAGSVALVVERHPVCPPGRLVEFESVIAGRAATEELQRTVATMFEGYVSHRTEAIYLTGLPDVPESRPHSEVNGRRVRR